MDVKPITFGACACLVIEGEQRTVPNDRIGGRSEDAMRVAVSPNNVAGGLCHFPAHSKERPRMGPGPLSQIRPNAGLIEPASSPIMVNQVLTSHIAATKRSKLRATHNPQNNHALQSGIQKIRL